MALFSSKKKKTEKVTAAAEKKAVRTVSVPASAQNVARVLIRPRITEKATILQEKGAYVFDVATDTTKPQIVLAVKRAYNVTPRYVNVVTIRAKNVRNMKTGMRGVKSGGKKAYVFLNKGDTITLF